MQDDRTYYNQSLWLHCDRQVTQSNLSIEKFVAKDGWGISPPKIKLNINNSKTKTSSCVVLSHQDVFSFILKFKPHESNLGNICNAINSDPNHQTTFSLKLKKHLIITFLNKIEYGGPAVRVVISEKTTDYLDSEKIYLSLHDFLSLVMVMGQFRGGYLDCVNSINSIIAIKDLSEKIDNLNQKVENYYSEFRARSLLTEQTSRIAINPDLPKEFDPFSVITPEEIEKERSNLLAELSTKDKIDIINKSNEILESKGSSSSAESDNMNMDMSSFITEKRDTFDIGIIDSVPEEKKTETTAAKVISNTFTEIMLQNDITNLEVYFNNLNTSDLPFSKFSDLIKSKIGFDPLEGVTVENINSLDYLLGNYLKFYIKKNLELKQEIPSSITPIVIDGVNVNENKISLAYDLFLYSIYYTQLKNILKEKDYSAVANKELLCFSIKSISSPYIFSVLRNIDEKIVVSEIINRFRKYKAAGVFTKLEKTIFDERMLTFSLTETALTAEASRMFGAINKNWNVLTVKETFPKLAKIMTRLSYEDIQKNKLTSEQIKKILAAEFSFRKNNKVNFEEAGISGFDDIPISIAEKYGVTVKKFDNTNLKRFIKEKCKNDERVLNYCLVLTNNINESYRDLKSVIVDFTLIPEEVLKSILLWDLQKDDKISTSYIYFLEIIKKSTLTKDMMISMLMDTKNINDPQFTNSFIAARDE